MIDMIYRPLKTMVMSKNKTYHHLLALTQDELLFIKTLLGKSHEEGVEVMWHKGVNKIALEIWNTTEKVLGDEEMMDIKHI